MNTIKFIFIFFMVFNLILCFKPLVKSKTSCDTTFSPNKPNVLIIEGVSQENEKPSDNKIAGGNQPLMLNLYQFSKNVITNTGVLDMEISTANDTKTIKAGTTDSIVIMDDKSIKLNYGGDISNILTKENQKPKVTIVPLYDLTSSKIHLSKLQKSVSYRVIITDDFTHQLDFKITGPVKYELTKFTENEIILDVHLDAFPSQMAFESYSNAFDKEKYSMGFNVIVKDKIAPHQVKKMGVYYFTEW